MALFTDDISINTIIGAGSAVSGNLRINGFVRVDGDIDGNLESTGNIIVGEKTRINGNISAESAVIGGIVLGNIIAPKKLKLLPSSAVVGDIFTKNLEIESNVIIHGHIIALKDEEEFTNSCSEYNQTVAIRSKVN